MNAAIAERFPLDQVLAWLPSTHDEDHVLHAILEMTAGEYGEIHQDVLDIQGGLVLDDATGWHLVQWGKRMGEGRAAVSEAEYRRFIAARRLTNASSGEPDRLARILMLLSNATGGYIDRVTTDQLGLGYTTNKALSGPARLKAYQQLIQAAPAGDHIGPVTETLPDYFGWDGEGGEEWETGTWIEAI